MLRLFASPVGNLLAVFSHKNWNLSLNTHYETLGVLPTASATEIRQAYIFASKLIHPDKFHPVRQKARWDQANEMLKGVNLAYEVLRDPSARSEYDRLISQNTTAQKETERDYYSPPPGKKEPPPPSKPPSNSKNSKIPPEPPRDSTAHRSQVFNRLFSVLVFVSIVFALYEKFNPNTTDQPSQQAILSSSPSGVEADPGASQAPNDLIPQAGEKWTNDLGMKFNPVPGLNVLFGVTDATVENYRAFVQSANYQMSGGIYVLNAMMNSGMYSLKWELDPSANWENPGFEQLPSYPVVGVSWNDAEAFCDWLTKRDRQAGLIGSNQYYRLPTDEEWSIAVGGGKYPWGDRWPPSKRAGNYRDKSYVSGLPGTGWSSVPVNDGYAHTSPVGSFHPNKYGLYDMGGNVLQWCQDWYRKEMNSENLRTKFPELNSDLGGQTYKVLRGSPWTMDLPEMLLSSTRSSQAPVYRYTDSGFRCVLDLSHS